ncbi:Membrane associated serine protease, rhomboid family [Halogranum rubrum]|uniref:Membrane associated serine protease, rhomboid family n=1 Tax=Halogranum rubrum TaxID=553466 RepID=A0A1I4FCT5_9EURY|nr:rhomboid family intramembrane serine protease [Halogranum rubrum]SFL14221.1 Membrane associated serine protease, rhomboid family [Halogranum rubrum]
MVPTFETLPVQRAAVVLAALLAVGLVWWVDRPAGRWGQQLRRRFVAGVPWGTVVSICFVLAVYLFVQGGLAHWFTPIVIPFTAWSYTYPLGMVTAAFSHSGPNHLVGNLVGTLTYAPLVEYAWGHYPRNRGSTSFSSWRTNPYVRAFVLFPVAVVVVGFATSFFGLGPVIGFSGVVFAFAGFALVYYPLGTVLALVAGQVIRLVYGAFLTPISRVSSREVFSTPWFADIALQGHALGFLLGVLLGLWVSERRRDDHPSALRLWTGVLLFSVAQSLWAVYWFRGNGQFILYRAGGLALVTLLATLVTAAVRTDDSRMSAHWDAAGAGRAETLRGSLTRLSRPQVAFLTLLLVTALLAGPGAGVNLLTAADDELDGPTVSVRDYEVTYAENVQNQMVAVANVEAFGETTTVQTSGVIVQSSERNLWITAVSKSQLAFDGSVPVRLGDVGWRETVVATRDGWEVEGNRSVYRVTLRVGDERTPVFASDPVRAEPVLAGQNVSLAADRDGYALVVGNGTQRARAPLPVKNESVALGGIEFTNEGRKLVARTDDGTVVRVATRETYS